MKKVQVIVKRYIPLFLLLLSMTAGTVMLTGCGKNPYVGYWSRTNEETGTAYT